MTLTQGIRKFNTALTVQVDEWNDEDGEGRDAVPAMSATWPRAGNGKEPRKGALLRKLDRANPGYDA